MSDFTFTVKVDNQKLLDEYAILLARFPQLMPIGAQKIAMTHRDRIVAILMRVPGERVTPWVFATRRQAIAYKLSHGFGRIPNWVDLTMKSDVVAQYPRGGPGSFLHRWQVEVTFASKEAMVEIEVSNDAKNTRGQSYVDFVIGLRQQPGFEMTGWGIMEDDLLDEENLMVKDYAEFFDQALQMPGGV